MIYGTSHFVSKEAAIEYYIDYVDPLIRWMRKNMSKLENGTRRWKRSDAYIRHEQRVEKVARHVQYKLEQGEIHIGKPTLQPGDKMWENDEGRYVIQECRATTEEKH